MRILVLFVDMVRPNLLHTNNPNFKKTPLSDFLENLGGKNYTNCFSIAPDTGRALGVFLTGQRPFENGCDNRVKYPRFFLKSTQNLFTDLSEKGYACDCYVHQQHILPENIMQNYTQTEEKLATFCQNIILEENHFIFMDIPTYHTVMDNEGFNKQAQQKADSELAKHLEKVFHFFDKDDFDDIFIFSDHGFKFSYEMLKNRLSHKEYLFLNEDRTNVLFLHRKKGEKVLLQDTTLMGFDTFYALITSKITNNPYNLEKEEYIIIEDHFHFQQKLSHIEIWARVMEKEIYIRTTTQAFLIERKNSHLLHQIISQEYDNSIARESLSFAEIVSIAKAKETANSNNLCVDTAKRCKNTSKVYKILQILKDFVWDSVGV